MVGDHLSTEIYRKPTDHNSLLRAESYHSAPLNRGLPICQCKPIRMSRICGTDNSFKVHSKDLQIHPGQRGYPDQWIKSAFDRFHDCSLDCLASRQKNTGGEQRINCFIQYSPLGSELPRGE